MITSEFLVGQNKDNQLHISSTISVIQNFRICFNLHFVMDCKSDWNFNCLGITLSFPRSLCHSFAAFSTNKRNKQVNIVSARKTFRIKFSFEGLIVRVQL